MSNCTNREVRSCLACVNTNRDESPTGARNDISVQKTVNDNNRCTGVVVNQNAKTTNRDNPRRDCGVNLDLTSKNPYLNLLVTRHVDDLEIARELGHRKVATQTTHINDWHRIDTSDAVVAVDDTYIISPRQCQLPD